MLMLLVWYIDLIVAECVHKHDACQQKSTHFIQHGVGLPRSVATAIFVVPLHDAVAAQPGQEGASQLLQSAPGAADAWHALTMCTAAVGQYCRDMP